MRAHGLLDQVRQVHVLIHVERADPGDALRFGHAVVGEKRLLALRHYLEVLGELVAFDLGAGGFRIGFLHLGLERGNLRLVARLPDVALESLGPHLEMLHLFVVFRPRLLFLEQVACEPVREFVSGLVVVRLAGDDERGAGLVDKNAVHLVDDGELAPTLHLLVDAALHVVAQVIEAELGGRAVGDIAPVHATLLVFVLHVHRVDRPDRHAERPEERKCPVAVALHEIVVHGDNVHAGVLDRGHVARERRNDRLSFTGAHFRDLALAEHHRADQLHVERPGAEGRPALGIKDADGFVQLDRDIDVAPRRDRLGAPEEVPVRLRVCKRGDPGLHPVEHRPRFGGKL